MSVLQLPDAYAFLKVTVGSADELLQSYIDEVEAAIGQRVGPLGPTPTTCRVVPRGTRLKLTVTPAVSLTSITAADGGGAVSTVGLYLDKDAGVVTYNDGSSFYARYYDVDYVAGRATGECPDDLILATKELLRHAWSSSQRAGSGRPAPAKSDSTANTVPGAAWDLPFRVEQLIAPHLQPGFS